MNFLHQICVAVLTNGNMLNVGNLCTNRIETRFYGQCRKATKVLVAIQPLLGNRELHFAVEHDRCGSVGVKHIEP